MRDYGAYIDRQSGRIALLLKAGQHWARASVNVDRSDVPPGRLMPDTLSPAPIVATERAVAQSIDFRFVQSFTGGETQAWAGTVIAIDDGCKVVTPYDDCVQVMPSVRQLRPGVTTVRLGRQSTDAMQVMPSI